MTNQFHVDALRETRARRRADMFIRASLAAFAATALMLLPAGQALSGPHIMHGAKHSSGGVRIAASPAKTGTTLAVGCKNVRQLPPDPCRTCRFNRGTES